MEAEHSRGQARHLVKINAFAATLAVAAMLPSAAAASPVVTPQVVTPQVVKPQVVKPQVVPAPEPQSSPVPRSTPAPPSTPAPLPSSEPSHSPIYGPGGGSSNDGPPAENEVPGSHIPSSDYAPAYPEGLPAHWEDGCGLDCLQEWYGWYDARRSAVSIDAMAGGSAQDQLNAKLLGDEVKAIEAAIEAMGGDPDPDLFAPTPVEQTPPDPWATPTAPTAPSSGPDVIPDAITSASPIISQDNDLGSWDLTEVFDAAEMVSGIPFADAIAKALMGGTSVCTGPKIQDRPEFCPQ